MAPARGLDRAAIARSAEPLRWPYRIVRTSASLEWLGCGFDNATATRKARELAVRLREAGLLVHYSGPFGTRIVLLPRSDDQSDGNRRSVVHTRQPAKLA